MQGEPTKQKICTSRVKGYSFDKESPVESSCGSDENYCDWNSSTSATFTDSDHGYCLPKDSKCYYDGVSLGKSMKGYKQLPMIGF